MARPRRGKVEVGGAVHGSSCPRAETIRDTLMIALLLAAAGEQVPHSCLQHEAEGVEPSRDDRRALAVACMSRRRPARARRRSRKMRDAILLAKPPACIDVE